MRMNNSLTPLESLFDKEHGSDLPLPPELATLYGRLQFPSRPNRSYVIANLVTSLDGVISLNAPGHSGGGDISGFNTHDQMVMGVLRASADAIIVGAATLRESADHLWTAEYIYPPLAEAYRVLRASLQKSETPLNVIVTARGEVDLSLPVFQSGKVSTLIVTTPSGYQRIHEQSIPPSVQVKAVQDSLSAQATLDAVNETQRSALVLVEGGPQLLGNFYSEHLLDEQFLTLAPQIAGRDDSTERPGLVSGKQFAPEHPIWGSLISIKRAQEHLFLRYDFNN